MEALNNNVPSNENNGNGDLFSSFRQEDLASVEDNDFQKINNESSDEDESTIGIPKRRRQRFSSNSETEIDKENIENQRIIDSNKQISTNIDSENEDNVITKQHKSKILKMSSDESEEDSKKVTKLELKNRIENKRSKLKDKFKHLHRNKESNSESHKEIENKTDKSSDDSSNEMFSLNKIKQKVKERRELLKTSICDPDTSDEEEKQQKQIPKHKTQRKSVKPTSPKPIKMSNKQAMENMQKIRSESNRMLREKDVSLPYHKPKALSLKDIMSRRRPALTNDGKALPIKMNEDELKKYALSLEQRQKEMLELCKSDTDDDDFPNNETLQSDGENVCTDNNKMQSDNEKAQDVDENLLPDTRQRESINENSQTVSEAISNDIKETHSDNEKAQSVNEEVLNENYELTECNGETENSSFSSRKITTNEAVVNKEHSLNCSNNEELNDMSESDVKLVYDVSIEDNENEITSKEDNLGVTSNVSKDINVTESDIINTDAVNELVESNEIHNINKESDECDALKISKVADLSIINVEERQQQVEKKSEDDSQLLSLHFDTLKDVTSMDVCENNVTKSKEWSVDLDVEKIKFDEFSDSDGEREDIDALLENAEILKTTDCVQELISPALVNDTQILKAKPRLSGKPNMLIDLSEDPSAPKKLSGLELLKQRFIYFENLKTSDEKEREREKRNIPGIQHLRLKEELAEKIAEQRSLEWTKRLQKEKQQQTELNEFEDEAMEEEDEIEKIKKQNPNDDVAEDSTASEEEIEYDVPEKPRKYNPLIEDEADESDCEDEHEDAVGCDEEIMDDVNVNQGNDEDETKDEHEIVESDDDDEEDSSEESSESEQEEQSKPKKGRILKAFEDSDDEVVNNQASENIPNNGDINLNSENNEAMTNSQEFTESQVSDDTIQLGQVQKSFSDDLFTSQDSVSTVSNKMNYNVNDGENPLSDEKDPGTFSNLNSGFTDSYKEKDNIRDVSFYVGSTYDGVTGICNETFSQSFVPTQIDNTPQSQEIGEDVFALCTGKFYDNQFVSQMDDPDENGTEEPTQSSQNIEIGFIDLDKTNEIPDIAIKDTIVEENVKNNKETQQSKTLDSINNCDVLKDILEELKEDAELPKPKYFDVTDTKQKVNDQFKKKFIIDSDDDDAEDHSTTEPKKKKFKKRKPEKRALQFSDDEDDDIDEYEEVEQESGDEVASEADNRLVEYDSEENEIEVNPRDVKKKRKTTEFFEKEAELTSEDEWVGSGDEDEAGLDRMEREEGDDDVFHQGKLQKELGQIHLRDMLDQDKRDVRLIQEVLFEDGDLGAGSRQRKYRWRDVGDEEETGAIPDEFGSQEADFESEEQWRKQRHEREVFLRSMRAEEKEDTSLIIKGSICNKSVSSLVLEVNSNTEIQSRVVDKHTVNTSIFKQSYHGSFLSRGNSALSRLAAIASPLAVDDDDAPRASVAPTNKRNFLFTSITPKEDKAKIAKRKADDNMGTPKLLKKMKADENVRRTSLFDHLKM